MPVQSCRQVSNYYTHLINNIVNNDVLLPFQIYVEYVVKNPLCRLDEPIQSELFASKLDTYIRSLNIFN